MRGDQGKEGLDEHGVEHAARLARRWRGSMWLVVAALLLLAVGGLATRGTLARRGPLVPPAHALGPTIRQLVDQGRMRFVFHHDARIGRESVLAANAATCAGDAGRFWPYHDALYADQAPENSGALTVARLIALGQRLGIDDPSFASCVRNRTYESWVDKVTGEAAQRGVNAIPTILVNGRPTELAGTPAGLRAAVQAAATAGG